MCNAEEASMDVLIFIYDDDAIKSVCDPIYIPHKDDIIVFNKCRFIVSSVIWDYDENKGYIHLDDE